CVRSRAQDPVAGRRRRQVTRRIGAHGPARLPADRSPPSGRKSRPAMSASTHLVGGTLAIAMAATGAVAQTRDQPLNTLHDVIAALRACWAPPPMDQSRPGMQITVQMSFRRNGEL